ncbi:MAG: hypothetical protein ABI051_05480 [Vicinamibacterales bacterium]
MRSHAFTSFHGSDVGGEQLSGILSEYVALERARMYRRLFVMRFGLLAAALSIIGFGLHWLSAAGSWVSVGLCAVTPAWAWFAELRCDWRLSERLNALPPDSTHFVVSPQTAKVMKSS